MNKNEPIPEFDDADHKIASLLRDSADLDLPKPNSKLREAVLNELSMETKQMGNDLKPSKQETPSTSHRSRFRMWAGLAVAASIVGLITFSVAPSLFQSEKKVARSVHLELLVDKSSSASRTDVSSVEEPESSLVSQVKESANEVVLQEFDTTKGDAGVVGQLTISEPGKGQWANHAAGQDPNSSRQSVISGINRAVIDRLTKETLIVGTNGFPEAPLNADFVINREGTAEQYDAIIENVFRNPVGQFALSTFSIDVDTASYANVRRFISQGQLPPPNAVRVEEMLNYFPYDYPQPKGDVPFSSNMEVAACPWNPENRLVRIGLKGKEIHVKERPASNVVFLIDVSGSMSDQNKLPLLKRGFQMMVEQLGENDRVSIVTYASGTQIRLKPTRGDQKKELHAAISSLQSGGSTNGSAGIQLAYELAQSNFIKGGTNRVILATDGDLNVGITQDGALVKLIEEQASSNVFLTVLGFGTGNLKDSKMEKLADHGNGMYAYIDGMREARKVLVEQLTGSLITIAKDVKIQLEFNPAEVKSYRLIGYENRVLANADFDNDQKDAGEIGAGHTVTALYEIVPVNGNSTNNSVKQQPTVSLKYQQGTQPTQQPKPDMKLTKASETGELLTLALRYKLPEESESTRIEFSVKDGGQTFNEASEDFRFAAAVAQFGLLLRQSKYAGSATFSGVEETASKSLGSDSKGYRTEFVDLVRKVIATGR